MTTETPAAQLRDRIALALAEYDLPYFSTARAAEVADVVLAVLGTTTGQPEPEAQQPTPAPAEETKPARPVSPIDEVRAWNEAHPVGTPVRVWTGAREGDGTLTRTRSRASVLGTHTAVVWVDGEGSCISLSHVDPEPASALTDDRCPGFCIPCMTDESHHPTP